MIPLFRFKTLLCSVLVCCATSVPAQLLYEISGRSAKAKSYIFATNKLADISFLDTVPNLFKVYGKCDKVITEMCVSDAEALAALSQAALLPDSARLRDYYSAQEYNRLNQSLPLLLHLSMEQVDRMKPACLTELYRNELLRKWLGYDEDRSMENFFQTVARQQGVPVIPLDDTGEAIYMAFDREPFHWQCKELLKIAEYPEREIKLEKTLLQYYKNGQLLEMSYQISMPDNLSTLSYSDYQIYCRRNRTWVKRLVPYLTEGNCFICLNAIYLGGDEGLLNLLKAAGYKVRPYNRKTFISIGK